jgi:hypothetical protein
MTIVEFGAARVKHRLDPPNRSWHRDEITELMRLYAILIERGNAKGYDYGDTENHEPQFYVLGPAPAQNCVVCVSRLSKDDRSWYIIEDGLGGLVAEGCRLRTLVNYANGSSGWLSNKLVLLLASFLPDALLMDEALTEEIFSVVSIMWFIFN